MLCARWHVIVLLLAFCTGSASAQGGSDGAAQLTAEAKAAANGGDLQGAEEKYRAVVRLEPRLPAAYNNLGKFFYEHGLLEKAIPPLQRAAELDPRIEAPRALLGFVYYQLSRYKEASQALSAAIKLKPSDQLAKLFLARSLGELDDLPGAVVLLEQLQHADPNNPEVLYSLGTTYSGLAKTALGRIQTVAPDSYLIELLLGSSAESTLQYAEAAEHYKKAIARSPGVPDLYFHYAHALAASGDAEGGLAAFREALTRDPYNASSNWEAARILVHTDPAEALRLADRALSISSTIPEAHMQKGRALLALGQAKEAAAEFQAAIALDPEDETAHFQLANAYRQMGLAREAAEENAIFLRMQQGRHTASEKSTGSAN